MQQQFAQNGEKSPDLGRSLMYVPHSRLSITSDGVSCGAYICMDVH